MYTIRSRAASDGMPLISAWGKRFVASGSWFSNVELAPKDPILGVTEAFMTDKNPDKMNLGVGAYRDDQGQPVVLGAVREAERRVAGSNKMEYLPIAGLRTFTDQSIKLAYGEDAEAVKEGRVAAVQALSGTGACRLVAEFQKRWLPGSKVYLPKPTWANHHNIWRDAGVERAEYRYYKPETRGLDFEGLMEDLSQAEPGSLVLLHACAHNPTGVDPSPDQWSEISRVVKQQRLATLFDSAYQGFASGDTERDAVSIRTFLQDGHQLFTAQSFAKNFGLYGQRIGCLSVVTGSPDEAKHVESQLKALARPIYSNPPLHGALLVDTILSDPQLKQQWYQEVAQMAKRIIDMRSVLRSNLESLGSSQSWKHITDQIGMFAFTGLTPEQVDALAAEHSIYMTRNGRISLAGVNSGNVERLAQAIHTVSQ